MAEHHEHDDGSGDERPLSAHLYDLMDAVDRRLAAQLKAFANVEEYLARHDDVA